MLTDNPCLENPPILVYLCLSTQLYEAVLLYDYCMDSVFTDVVFVQLVLLWCSTLFLSSQMKDELVVVVFFQHFLNSHGNIHQESKTV